MLLLPMMAQAQTVLTEEQQLEQAQKQLEAAKKALEIAKLKAEAARLKAQTDSINKAAEEAEKQAKALEDAPKSQANSAKTEVPAPTVAKEPTTKTGWVVPTAVAAKKEEPKKTTLSNGVVLKEDPKYLEGAVTLNAEGKVEFTTETNANGKTADQIYNIVYQYMSELTQGENNIASRVALVNKDEHVIANTMDEWLVFSASFISLDRSEFRYNLVANITDNHLKLTLGRIVYNYEEGRSTGFKETAENVITDKYALTKKKNDLAKIYGKFRRLTIDRKDQIFSDLTKLVKE